MSSRWSVVRGPCERGQRIPTFPCSVRVRRWAAGCKVYSVLSLRDVSCIVKLSWLIDIYHTSSANRVPSASQRALPRPIRGNAHGRAASRLEIIRGAISAEPQRHNVGCRANACNSSDAPMRSSRGGVADPNRPHGPRAACRRHLTRLGGHTLPPSWLSQ